MAKFGRRTSSAMDCVTRECLGFQTSLYALGGNLRHGYHTITPTRGKYSVTVLCTSHLVITLCICYRGVIVLACARVAVDNEIRVRTASTDTTYNGTWSLELVRSRLVGRVTRRKWSTNSIFDSSRDLLCKSYTYPGQLAKIDTACIKILGTSWAAITSSACGSPSPYGT